MYVIIWEFHVKADCIIEFERFYNSNGAWADLFKKNDGYLGTELLRNKESSDHYLTIDRWASLEAYEEFKKVWQTEYEALDAKCEGLTTQETLLGKYEETTNNMQ